MARYLNRFNIQTSILQYFFYKQANKLFLHFNILLFAYLSLYVQKI